MMEENIVYMGWPHCIRLRNAEVELIIATDIGLRILHVGFIGKQNFFYLSPDQMGKTGGDSWRIYGGHRLWHAPEVMPRTYAPDNDPVFYSFDSDTLKISQPKESSTGIIKEMEIRLSPDKNQVTILHRLINENRWDVKLSAWALSALAKGGRAIIPQEPFGEGDDYLLPARSMALWQYTRMNDPRWIWGSKYIQAMQDSSQSTEQKIGVLNKQGWSVYSLKDELLMKIVDFNPTAEYPDFNCNQEIYINGNFLEMETLGPVVVLPPQGFTEHTEHWSIVSGKPESSEDSIDQVILPKILAFQNEIKFIRGK